MSLGGRLAEEEFACEGWDRFLRPGLQGTAPCGRASRERKDRSHENHAEEPGLEVGRTSRSAAGVHAGLFLAPKPEPDLEVRRGSRDPPHQCCRDFHLDGWRAEPWRLPAVAARS